LHEATVLRESECKRGTDAGKQRARVCAGGAWQQAFLSLRAIRGRVAPTFY
jgi:hypothetical protein